MNSRDTRFAIIIYKLNNLLLYCLQINSLISLLFIIQISFKLYIEVNYTYFLMNSLLSSKYRFKLSLKFKVKTKLLILKLNCYNLKFLLYQCFNCILVIVSNAENRCEKDWLLLLETIHYKPIQGIRGLIHFTKT